MPTKIQIIHAHDFLKATSDGKLDLEASKQLLTQIASASVGLEDHDIILDTRAAHSSLTAFDLWYLAREVAIHRNFFGRKKAILCPPERFDHAELFALCAQDRGLKAQAFTSYEDAMEWILEKEPEG
jgi:hypothetical protein